MTSTRVYSCHPRVILGARRLEREVSALWRGILEVTNMDSATTGMQSLFDSSLDGLTCGSGPFGFALYFSDYA